jgi:hypothetical protein
MSAFRISVLVFIVTATVYGCCPIKGVGDLFWSLPDGSEPDS